MDEQQTEDRFWIWAETDGQSRPLIVAGLTFGRLFDDVVVPYQTGSTFFLDGVPLHGKELKRIKILRARPGLDHALSMLRIGLTRSDTALRKIYGDQYAVRYEAALRENTDDVTAQAIKAYDRAIKPSIKDYLPKREALLEAASKILVEAIKVLGT